MQQTSRLMKAFGTNNTASAFATIIPTITEPVGVNFGEVASGIINLVPGLSPPGFGKVPDFMLCAFFGAGADNATFDARWWGWDRIGSETTLWIPRPLASFVCTLSTTVGVAGAQVINTDRIVDTLVVNAIAPQPFLPGVNATPAAEYLGTVRVMSPANQMMAWTLIPLMGVEKVHLDLDMTGATDGNALFRFISCDD